jgi:hypothetical protein
LYDDFFLDCAIIWHPLEDIEKVRSRHSR